MGRTPEGIARRKAARKLYNITHREQIRAYSRLYESTHKKEHNERAKKFYALNKERIISNRTPEQIEAKRKYSRERAAKYRAEHREEHNRKVREWNFNHKDKVKQYTLKRMDKQKNERYIRVYGITLAQVEALADSQSWSCAICGSPLQKKKEKGRRDLVVDHNHNTGKVRGLLCQFCNIGLGNFKDNPDLLIKAADYLRKS